MHSRAQGRILFLAGIIVLCSLGLLISLPSSAASDVVPSSSVPSASASANEDGGPNAPAPEGNYPLTLAEGVHKTQRHPVNASLLTMLVLASSFGASVLWMATNDRRRRAASRSWGADDRRWVAVACEGPSFLGVFRL
jgi:hypothetical protein